MKVGIVGSRSRKDKDTVRDLIEGLPKETTIVSGGRDGVDSWAIEIASELGLRTIEFCAYIPPPDSHPFSVRSSKKSQNQKIINRSEVIYALVSEDRIGDTEDLIKLAKRSGVPVEIVELEESENSTE